MITTALYMLRCYQCGLNIAELEQLSIGTVIDILTEAQNDRCEYKQVASQSDFDKWKK